MTSNLQKINWCAPQIHYTYLVFIGIFTYSVCVCVCVSAILGHTFALFWWNGHKVDTDSGQTPSTSPSPDTLSVGLGGTWHFQENPHESLDKPTSLNVRGFVRHAHWDAVWSCLCKQKSLKFHELHAIFFYENDKKKSDNSRWNAGNMLRISKCPKLKDLIWLKKACFTNL